MLEYVQKVLASCGGHRHNAAKILGISPRGLRDYCKEIETFTGQEIETSKKVNMKYFYPMPDNETRIKHKDRPHLLPEDITMSRL